MYPTQPSHYGSRSHRSSDAGWAIAVHLLGLLFTVIAPLVVLAAIGPSDTYVRQHARQAVAFQCNVIAVAVLGTLASGAVPAFLLSLPLFAIAVVAYPVIAAVRASRGQWQPYPLMIPFIADLPEPVLR